MLPEYSPWLSWTRIRNASWSESVLDPTVGRDVGPREASGPKSRVTTPSGRVADTEAPEESPNTAVGAPPQRVRSPELRTVTAIGKKASSNPESCLSQRFVPTARDTEPELTLVGLESRRGEVCLGATLTAGVHPIAKRTNRGARKYWKTACMLRRMCMANLLLSEHNF